MIVGVEVRVANTETFTLAPIVLIQVFFFKSLNLFQFELDSYFVYFNLRYPSTTQVGELFHYR